MKKWIRRFPILILPTVLLIGGMNDNKVIEAVNYVWVLVLATALFWVSLDQWNED